MLRHAVPAYPDEGQADLGRRKYLPCIPPNGKHSLGIDRLPLVRGYRSRLSLCRPRGQQLYHYPKENQWHDGQSIRCQQSFSGHQA